MLGRTGTPCSSTTTSRFSPPSVSEFLAPGLASNHPVIVIATPSHRKAFFQALREHEIDVDRARQSGQLTVLDARQTLKKICVDEEPECPAIPKRDRQCVQKESGRS